MCTCARGTSRRPVNNSGEKMVFSNMMAVVRMDRTDSDYGTEVSRPLII